MHCNIPTPDLHARLDGTVCLYKDKPVFIRTNGESDALVLYDVITARNVVAQIRSTDRELDIATPPLGYVQVMNDVIVYTCRRPLKQYKQGITLSTLLVNDVKGGSGAGSRRFEFFSPAFHKTMSREYPSLESILDNLRERDEGVYCELAVCNDCALVLTSGVTKVLFREEEVGIISKKDLQSSRPVVRVPSTKMGWIVERYLSELDFVVVTK
jgi:hypothetical protein